MLAVHHNLDASLRILSLGMLPSQYRGTGRQKFEAREVSIEQWQALDLLVGESSRHISPIGLDQRYIVRRYSQFFLGSANLKLYIDSGRLIGIHRNASGFDDFESRGLC